MADEQFARQDNLERAPDNCTAFILATLVYSKRQGFSFEEWAQATGALFAPGWDTLADSNVRGGAREAARNMASIGATGVAMVGDDRQAEVTGHWPSDDLLTAFGVARAEIVPFYHIFTPIAERLGLRYAYAVEGDRFQCTFTRR